MQIIKDYNGIRWGIAFLLTDSRLSEEEKDELFSKAIILDLNNEKKIKVKTETLEGKVYRVKPFCVLGTFAGAEYHADIDRKEYGISKLKFLVSEQTSDKYQPN